MLDVGCGGGFLTEEIAKYGLRIIGIDPSTPSLESARSHAEKIGLRIQYLEGMGERIPFPDSSFDIVFCCDVLEHVNDYQEVLKEVNRVLRPVGWLFFETINRTLFSFFVVVFLLQECEFTSIIPRNIHCWENFIKPEELQKSLDFSSVTPPSTLVYATLVARGSPTRSCYSLREGRFSGI